MCNVFWRNHHPWGSIAVEKAISWVEQVHHLALCDRQKDARRLALQSNVCIIAGGPGVGKTTLVRSVLRVLWAKRLRVTLCAPIGRAANRLAESTGMEARTIHRTLEFDPKTCGFKFGKDQPLDIDLLVLDEASMVELMNKLLSAIPDPAALVHRRGFGPTAFCWSRGRVAGSYAFRGNSHCALHRSLLPGGPVPNYSQCALNQGGENAPVPGGRAESDYCFISASTSEEIDDRLLRLVTERIPQRFHLYPIRDILVITSMNRGGLGARALNILLQEKLNAVASEKVIKVGATFSTGDKVIKIANDHEKQVFSNDVRRITGIDTEESAVTMHFEDREVVYPFGELDELQLAHATSIHKSQGSEYPAVVIPLAIQH